MLNCIKLFFEEETSIHQRSIFLVDIINAIGFSKCEREIQRYHIHLYNVLMNMFRTSDKSMYKITGSTVEGMHGGIYSKIINHDCDILITSRKIKLYTPRKNNVNNLPLLLLHDNADYSASCFVDEDDNFPGYVKLSLVEVKTKYLNLFYFRRMNDKNKYLSNYMVMNSLYELPYTTSKYYTGIPFEFHRIFKECFKKDINGLPLTSHRNDNSGYTITTDCVYYIHHDMWPNSANSFITRRKPNNWPSKSMLENIQSQRCDIASIGHHDSKNNDIQWRITFHGKRNLLLNLTDVQILCYALIKIILMENLNTFQREVVSSFHIKHVMFWYVELCSCQWVYSNYINCLNVCLTQLIQMIKARHIPHYIIERRNMINSKMTERMLNEIVDVLSKYDTTYVFTLNAFESVFKLTHYNNALLKREALKSTIIVCFNACLHTFASFVFGPSYFWNSHIPHNAIISLLNCASILQNLKKSERSVYSIRQASCQKYGGFLILCKV